MGIKNCHKCSKQVCQDKSTSGMMRKKQPHFVNNIRIFTEFSDQIQLLFKEKLSQSRKIYIYLSIFASAKSAKSFYSSIYNLKLLLKLSEFFQISLFLNLIPGVKDLTNPYLVHQDTCIEKLCPIPQLVVFQKESIRHPILRSKVKKPPLENLDL